MTFLYGQTTWDGWIDKFADLVSGTAPDDQGTTCALADRWRVRFGPDAGSSYRSIAPPASQDLTVTQEHRQGYWLRYDDCCIYNNGNASGKDFLRQKTIWTQWHANFKEWLVVTAKVTVANTVVGNYSTARVALYAVGFDNVGNATAIVANTTLTPTTDGTCTYTYNSCTITFQIGNADTGKVTVNSFYARSFTAAFPGGVDAWRNAARNVDGLYEFTAGDVPVGVDGTDYVVNIGPLKHGFWGANTVSSVPYNNLAGKSQVAGSSTQTGGTCGLAIKTNAALTGSHYTVTFTKSQGCGYLLTSGGSFYLGFGGVGQALDGSFIRGDEGETYLTGAMSFLTASPANGSSIVQYWISVAATHIAVVLNVEGTSGWTITSNLYAKVVSDDATYGTCWMRGFWGSSLLWMRNGAHSIIERALSQGKGFYDGGRDWQTGFGRYDTMPLDYYSDWRTGEQGFSDFYWNQWASLYVLTHGSNSSSSGMPLVPWTITLSRMPLSDSRWQLAGFSLMDGDTPKAVDTTTGSVGKWKYRGYVSEGLYQTPAGTFNHGDELTDTVSGNKYLLWNSNANTFPSYAPEASGTNPGIVLEEE